MSISVMKGQNLLLAIKFITKECIKTIYGSLLLLTNSIFDNYYYKDDQFDQVL